MTRDEVSRLEEEFDSYLEQQLESSRKQKMVVIQQFLEAEWKGMDMPVPRILKIHLKQAFPGKTLTRSHEK